MKKIVYFSEKMPECSIDEIDNLFNEQKIFPVKSVNEKTDCLEKIVFEDGYGKKRSYGGNRIHEGIDIMPLCKEKLAVCSVCDGKVEKIGWLRLGGYRIGVRDRNGLYYYYAHLEKYRRGLKMGDSVKKGEILGIMGNTGYGPEGTRGKFARHLHFGIYHNQKGKEKSINSYYFLRYLSGKN